MKKIPHIIFCVVLIAQLNSCTNKGNGPSIPTTAFKRAVDSCSRYWWQHNEENPCGPDALDYVQLQMLDGDHSNKPFGTGSHSSGNSICQGTGVAVPGAGTENLVIGFGYPGNQVAN